MYGMKKCNICLKEFPLDCFHKKVASKDGYNNICKSCKKIKNDKFYEENRESKLEYQKKYCENNKEAVYARNYAYDKIHHREYFLSHKEERLAYGKKYINERAKDDPSFKLSLLLRTRFYHALKNGFKMKSVIELIGCNIDEFKQKIEEQFLPEMNWNNWGLVWELDHTLPCASFDMTNIEDQKICFHYSNMKPIFKTTKIAESFGYREYVGNRNKRSKIL